jgi:hypothetical protein
MFDSGAKKRASLRGGGTAVRNPKLSAVAVASMTGNDFAMRLDRAIMRSGKLIEAKAIESPQAPSSWAAHLIDVICAGKEVGLRGGGQRREYPRCVTIALNTLNRGLRK